jgi:CheY-like chemotaxis protein
MPETDGITLLEVRRSYRRWHKVPVIVLSASVSDAQAGRLRALGVAHVFLKAQYKPGGHGRSGERLHE